MTEEEKLQLHDLQMKSYDAYLNIGTTIRKDAVVLKLVPLIGGNQACQYSHEHHGQELGCHLFDFFAAAQGRTILASIGDSNLIYFIYTAYSHFFNCRTGRSNCGTYHKPCGPERARRV